MLRIATEQLQDLLHAELACAALAALDGLVGELAFLFLEIEDPLFDGVFDGDFVDDYVGFLGEAVDAVDSLFFDELWGIIIRLGLICRERGEGGTYGIPERLEDDDTCSGCKIESQ